jgi:intermediate peptidase
VLKWVPDSALRKEMYVLDNGPPLGKLKVLVEMLKKRQQLAKESSFPSYADMALKDNRMAGSPERVKKFLNDLATHIAPKVEKEMQLLKAEKAKHEQDSTIYAWDKAFYCGITKAQKFELDGSRLAEYFSLGNCIEGLNIIVSNLFGLELKVVPMGKGESWHPSVRKVAVLEEGQVIGYIYMDLFYREKKLKNAASFAIQFSKAKDGKLIQLPKMALVCNFGAGNPPLLSHDGVVTLFHEFGHCLNMLLSRTEYQHVAGTRAALDFVEMPSTLMEYFTWDHRVVKLFAKHYKNGDILEESMLMNLKGSKNMFSGLSTEHQILLAMADIVLHDGSKNITDPNSLVEVLKSLQNSHTSLPHVDGTFVLTHFNHLVQYAAGYYTYLFCRVFSSNVWKKCFSENPLSREMGELYRREILQPGGSRDPNKMLRRILGRDPTMDSFLEELE